MSSFAGRTLVALLVYNGQAVVPRCLESLARLDGLNERTDVLLLDDSSSDPGWSDHLRELSRSFGFSYYRSPRNLGIPRNMNLGLLFGLSRGYEQVLLLNSDVVAPRNLVDGLVEAANSDPSIASVTAWSNNVSSFSLPNHDPEFHLTSGPNIDWVSSLLRAELEKRFVDLPSAVGFCVLIPSWAARTVGLFDPVFGRGYCEEIDWSQRAKSLGYRNLLAPTVFAYHSGSGSTRKAGLLQKGQHTVPANEAIIDLRYPNFRTEVGAFTNSGVLDVLSEEANLRIVRQGAIDNGYCLDAAWLSRGAYGTASDSTIHFSLEPDGDSQGATAAYLGFRAELALHGAAPISTLEKFIGRPPLRIGVFDHGVRAKALIREARSKGVQVVDARSYPERV